MCRFRFASASSACFQARGWTRCGPVEQGHTHDPWAPDFCGARRCVVVVSYVSCFFSFSNLRVFLRVFQMAPIYSLEACFEEKDPKDGPITAFRNKDEFPSQQARESPCFTLTTFDNFLLTRYVRRYETTRPEMRLSVVREARQRVAPSLPRYVCCNESWLCAM